MIFHHVAWNYNIASEFTSWSASLLYVLIHAVRRTYLDFNREVMVYVMDTSKLEHRRISLASKLLGQCEVEMPSNKSYDPAEYLIHGKLINTNGLWKAVPLNDLIEAGLCRKVYREDEKGWCLNEMSYVFPTINKPKTLEKLALRIEQLRRGYFNNRMDAINDERLPPHVEVAKCFGDEWYGIMLIALLSSRQRKLNFEGLNALEEALDDVSLPEELPWLTSGPYSAFNGVPDCIETIHFMELLRTAIAWRQMHRLAASRHLR